MAQSVPSPGVSAVSDPGAIRYPVNSIMPTPALGGAPQGPAVQAPGGPSAAPGVPQGGITRPQSTLPLNTPRTQAAPQLGGGSPAPAIQAVSGVGGNPSSMPAFGATTPGATGGGVIAASGISNVPDPGASRFTLNQNQAIGSIGDQAMPEGGDPGATGGYVPGPTQAGAQWSQFNPNANPNPGALSGGAAGPAPTYLPGQTGISQVSPEANPNPGGL